MKYEYYAELADQSACPTSGKLAEDLVVGFVDGCTTWFALAEIERAKAEAEEKSATGKKAEEAARERMREAEKKKNEARRCYMQRVKEHVDQAFRQNQRVLGLPPELNREPDFENLSSTRWIALKIDFVLLTPWYSKDDRVFHVLDNPVRKDRVFGVPFMAASSWKGMLRWAFRIVTGLADLQRDSGEDEQKKTRIMEVYLFGHEKDEREHEKFREGALVFYSTWFDRSGFEVINPHSRKRRAGTQPIHYEVVPPGARGTLSLLYAPLPGAAKQNGVTATEAIEKLLKAVKELLTTYGISAKRTVGWGTAKIERWKAYRKGCQPIEKPNLSEFWSELQTWLSSEVGP